MSGATVSGKVASSLGGTTSYWVEFGPTTAYGSETTHQSVVLEKNTPREVRSGCWVWSGRRPTTTGSVPRTPEQDQTRGICGVDRRFVTQSVSCGQTITTDVRLTGNLDCLHGSGPKEGPRAGDRCRRRRREPRRIQHPRGDLRRRRRHQGASTTPADTTTWWCATAASGAGATRSTSRARAATRSRNVSAQGSPTGVFDQRGAQNEIRRSGRTGRTTGIEVQGEQGLAVTDSEVIARLRRCDRGLRRRWADRSQPGGDRRLNAHRGLGHRVTACSTTTPSAERRGSSSWAGPDNVVSGNDASEGSWSSNPARQAARPATGSSSARAPPERWCATTSPTTTTATGSRCRARARACATTGRRPTAFSASGRWPGVVDLGGNSASGNGNPLQCVNVFCQ